MEALCAGEGVAKNMPRSTQVPQQCPQAPLAPALAILAPRGDQ